MDLFENTCRPKHDPAECDLVFSLPPPAPSRKTVHNLPKTSLHQDVPSPMFCPRDRSHDQSPSMKQLCGPRRGFIPPEPTNDHVLTPSRTLISSSLVIARTTTSVTRPTAECDLRHQRILFQQKECPHNGPDPDYPLTGPSPGVNPTIHPSSLASTWVKMSRDIFPRTMDFFSFPFPEKIKKFYSVTTYGWRTTQGIFTTTVQILFYNRWKQNFTSCGKLQMHCSEFHQWLIHFNNAHGGLWLSLKFSTGPSKLFEFPEIVSPPPSLGGPEFRRFDFKSTWSGVSGAALPPHVYKNGSSPSGSLGHCHQNGSLGHCFNKRVYQTSFDTLHREWAVL